MTLGGDSSGYTIVETMVFLAVTGILFVSAVATVQGKQAVVQFSQGTRDAQSKIQDVINQVSTGYYPSTNSISCTAPSGGAPIIVAGSKTQGSSDDCIFLGKVIQLGTSGGTGFNAFSVAARRQNASTNTTATSLEQALPTAMAPTSNASSTPDSTEKTEFDYGLIVTRIMMPLQPKNSATGKFPAGAFNGTTYGAVAFFTSLPTVSSGLLLASGAQHVSFGVVPESTLNDSTYKMAERINLITDNPAPSVPSGKKTITLDPANGVVMCLSDDGGSRKAMITIGGASSQTVARLDVGSYDTGVCP